MTMYSCFFDERVDDVDILEAFERIWAMGLDKWKGRLGARVCSMDSRVFSHDVCDI